MHTDFPSTIFRILTSCIRLDGDADEWLDPGNGAAETEGDDGGLRGVVGGYRVRATVGRFSRRLSVMMAENTTRSGTVISIPYTVVSRLRKVDISTNARNHCG